MLVQFTEKKARCQKCTLKRLSLNEVGQPPLLSPRAPVPARPAVQQTA